MVEENKLRQNILFITDGIFPLAIGGIQRYSRLLLEQIGKDNLINVTVIHPHKDVEMFKDYQNITEVIIDDIDKSKLYLKECYNYSKRVYEFLKDKSFDVIYSQGISAWYNIKKYPSNLIVNHHGLEAFQPLTFKDKLFGLPFRLIQKNIFKKATHVISEGGKMTSIIKEIVDDSKITYIPNAVNLPDIKNTQKDYTKLKILFVARFAYNKGIDILLDVAEELNADGYEIDYILGGKGELFNEMKEKYTSPNIQFLGFVSDEDLLKLYETSHIFVLPTLFEGMPTVVLEAMAHRLPIIVSNVGATAELVDETNGYLIERNNKQVLKTAILDFINLSLEEKNKLSKASFEKVKANFTWEIVARKHYELFNRMTNFFR